MQLEEVVHLLLRETKGLSRQEREKLGNAYDPVYVRVRVKYLRQHILVARIALVELFVGLILGFALLVSGQSIDATSRAWLTGLVGALLLMCVLSLPSLLSNARAQLMTLRVIARLREVQSLSDGGSVRGADRSSEASLPVDGVSQGGGRHEEEAGRV